LAAAGAQDGFLFLDTDVSTAMERLKKRGRDEETNGGVPREYLESLHRMHREWLTEEDAGMGGEAAGLDRDIPTTWRQEVGLPSGQGPHVLRLDGSMEFETSPTRAKELARAFEGFVRGLVEGRARDTTN